MVDKSNSLESCWDDVLSVGENERSGTLPLSLGDFCWLGNGWLCSKGSDQVRKEGREEMKRCLTILFIGVSIALWCFQMTTGLLLEFLPQQFYLGIWGLILAVFVIWPLIYDFIKEADHEID